jgi:N-acetylglutamate synthase-like GNAT family acetyltransferase
VPAQYIEDGGVFVAEAAGSVRGFATILPTGDGNVELDALFVEPDVWRRGIGSSLMKRCISEAHATGAITLHVVGNPHAEGFYRKCGFEVVGERMMRFGTGLVMKGRLP